MKCFIITLWLSFCIFWSGEFLGADEIWHLVAGINESDIREVFADPYNPGIIYVASRRTLYKSEDYGKGWHAVFTVKGDSETINYADVSKEGVFICTDRGVFFNGGKSTWRRIFRAIGRNKNRVQHIAFSKGHIYLGTNGGLFVSKDGGGTWVKDNAEAGSLSITWIAFLDGDIFLSAETGVYKKIDNGWKRVFVTIPEEVTAYEETGVTTLESAFRPVNSIYITGGNILLATDAGVYISTDKGESWTRFPSGGLLTKKVKRILCIRGPKTAALRPLIDKLYALTDVGIFEYIRKEKIWKSLYRGMSGTRMRSISVDSRRTIWVATDKGVYKSVAMSASSSIKTNKDVEVALKFFDYEPTINEIQQVAIRYAEVHPDKIKQWRESAKRKAWLPSVSVGLDRYVTDLYHWDAGQNPDVLQKGRDTVSWDITVTWDLGELIWNGDQTSIDTRSRLMVQLRDDILDEITRTYFERRRLQLEMHLYPSGDLRQNIERTLRIQELTADLDALTGGYFSDRLSSNR